MEVAQFRRRRATWGVAVAKLVSCGTAAGALNARRDQPSEAMGAALQRAAVKIFALVSSTVLVSGVCRSRKLEATCRD